MQVKLVLRTNTFSNLWLWPSIVTSDKEWSLVNSDDVLLEINAARLDSFRDFFLEYFLTQTTIMSAPMTMNMTTLVKPIIAKTLLSVLRVELTSEGDFSLPSVVGAPVIIAVELDPVNVVVCGTVPECTSDEETIYKLGFGVDLLQCI